MTTTRKTLAGVVGAVAAATLIAFTGSNEGSSNAPYRDTGGVWTVCRGQTGVEMRYYSDKECDAMFADSLAGYASQVRAVTPGFDTLPDGVKAAIVDFSYNVGVSNYQNSTLRSMIVRRELPQACDQFLRWRMVAGKDCSVRANNCYGVWTRRQAERNMCKGEAK